MLSPILFDDSSSDSSFNSSLSSVSSFNSSLINSNSSISSFGSIGSIPSLHSVPYLTDSDSSISTMNSNRSSRSGRSAALAGSAHSSGTEDYEIPEVILNNRRSQRNRGSVIEINETQEQPGLNDEEEEEDDDVILIPEHIETIDLCTQVPVAGPVPRRLRNQVIDITGSPAPPLDITMPIADLPQSFHRIERIARRVSTRRSISAGRDVAGPSRGRRNNNRAAPYVSPVTPATAKTSTPKPPAARALSLDDSFNASQLSAIKINCPICLESVKEREPISTMCGHVFCKACIQAAMVTVKKCPMCKKNLPAKNPFIHLFI